MLKVINWCKTFFNKFLLIKNFAQIHVIRLDLCHPKCHSTKCQTTTKKFLFEFHNFDGHIFVIGNTTHQPTAIITYIPKTSTPSRLTFLLCRVVLRFLIFSFRRNTETAITFIVV